MLKKLNAHEIIQDVTMIGGTFTFSKNKPDQWMKIFSNFVNGKVKNIYTPKDWFF